jgi:transcriptional regulator with XRE-family HTH domain
MTSKLDPAQAKLLGARFRQARQSRALALQEVAAKCEIHHSQLSRLERGQFKRLSDNVQKVCKYLHIKPHESMVVRADVAELHARLDALVSSEPRGAEVLAALLDALDTFKSAV